MRLNLGDIINKRGAYKIESQSIPLRIWSKEWAVPNRIKLEKYSVSSTTSHKTQVEISRYSLWGIIGDPVEFEKMADNKNAPKKWGKGKESKRRFDYKLFKNELWIKILSKSYLFNINNRTMRFDEKYLRLSLLKDELGFWYISGDGQVRFVILPKFINLDEEFFELLGFLDGEMSKKTNKSGGSVLKISNADPVMIREILKRFDKYFRIHKSSWTASLVYNNKLGNFDNKKDLVIRNIWSNAIELPKDRFTKTTFQDKYNSLFSKYGIIQIRYSNTAFFLLFLELMENVRSLILSNYGYCAAYIRGIVAAEGGIGKREGKLRMVHIGGMDGSLKDFYKKCVIKLGIDSVQTYKLRIEIYGLKNFLKLEAMDIFKYQERRKKDFNISLGLLKKSPRYRATL